MEPESNQLIQSLSKKQSITTYSIILIFVLAFGIRLFRINTHPLVFHPIKQYRSALFARSYFYESQKHIEFWKKNPSLTYRKSRGIKEPRILEYLAFFGYKLTGEEQIWIPRLLSVVFWMLGGLLVYILVKKMFNQTGSLFSLLFYFFLPFGINISQSFIPEALMTLFYIWSILIIFRYYQVPNRRNLIYAALVSGVAILIKLIVVFPIFGGFVFLGIRKHGLKKFVFNSHTIQFFFMSLVMGVFYYVYHILFMSALRSDLIKDFIPRLLGTSFFWKGWIQQIGKVTGLIPFILGIFCFFTVKDKTVRVLFLGLLSGYFFYGIIFIYSTATHDYYQIAIFPIVIIMLGQIGKLIERRKKFKFFQKEFTLFPILFSFTILIVIFSLIYNFHFLNNSTENKSKWSSLLLCGNQFAYFSNNRIEPEIIVHAWEIGKAVEHSTKTIILSRAYGNPLMYYGNFYGKAWPTEDDFWHRRLRGIPKLNAAERFNKHFNKFNPHYFIVHEKWLLNEQPDLHEFLNNRFYKIKDTQDYVIFKILSEENS